jgi:AcrR family transcriptional regulator
MARLPVEERRRQLSEAAIRVMTRDGVARATTRAIASEAEVSLSVFHYCFETKQDLFESVIRQILSHTVRPAKASFEVGGNLRDSIRGALGVYWQHVLANPAEHQLTYELTQYVLREPGLAAVATMQYDAYAAAYVEVFERLHELLGVESAWPVTELATYFASLVDGLTLNWLVLRDDAAAERVLDRMADQVAGLLGEPISPAG